MEQKKTKSEKNNKTNQLLIIVLSVSFSFTVFFFSPAELFIRNQQEYLVGAVHVLLPMLVLALLTSVADIVLLNLLLMIHESLFIVLSRLMSGLLLAFYMQEMFMNGKMTAITGDPIKIDHLTWDIILNLMIFFLIVMLPLLLYSCGEQFPKVKIFKIGKGYAIPYLTGLLFIMQLFGLTGSVAQYGINRYEGFYNTYLSYEPSMSLSNEKNVVVFIEDRLDSFYMDEILETYPDMYNELDGFTFYQNNLSHYTNTFPSIANMLTCLPYDGETEKDYLEKAWNEKSFLDDLKENDFHINLLVGMSTTYGVYDVMEDKCDNLVYYPDTKYHFNYLGKNGVIPIMTRLSLGRLVPYSFKEPFLDEIQADFSERFVKYNNSITDYMPKAVGTSSDIKYYDYLISEGLTNDNSNKTFSFIHLNGAHNRSEEISAIYSDDYNPGSFGTLSTTRGDFEIIFTYIRQMKELGIYDNSTIIIVGDHGRPPTEVEHDDLDILKSPIVTTLLIKPENADSGSLKLDKSSELSNDFLAASVLEYAGMDHSKYGYSYNDIINNNLHTERCFQLLDYSGVNGGIDFLSSYKITGDARDFNNWVTVK